MWRTERKETTHISFSIMNSFVLDSVIKYGYEGNNFFKPSMGAFSEWVGGGGEVSFYIGFKRGS